jgi:two-component system, NarL family, sensor histidine kinase EvgS
MPIVIKRILFAMSIALAAVAHANDVPSVDKRPLRAATDAGAWPLAFGTPGEPAQGINADYWRALVKGTDLQDVEIVAMPWGEAFEAFRSGRIDFIVGAVRTREREAYARFTPPYYATMNVLVARVGSDAPVSFQDLAGARLAILNGHFMVPVLARQHPEMLVRQLPTPIAALDAVATGQADAALVALEVAVRELAGPRQGQLFISGLPMSGTAEFGVMVQPALEPQWQMLSVRVGRIDEATHSAIRKRWLRDDIPAGLHWKDWLKRAAPVGMLLLGLLVGSLWWGLRWRSEAQRRELAEANLQLAYAKSHATASARQRFIGFLAHETRSLVGTVQAGLQLLGPQVDGQNRRIVRALETSAGSLRNLLDSSLDTNRIDAGRLDLVPQALPVGPLINTIVTEFQPMAELGGTELSHEGSDKDVVVWADEVRLLQVLRNLVANAVKFAPGGRARLSARTEGGRIAIEIADNGRGLSPDQAQRLFVAFEQAEADDRYSGSGLGLSLSREIARQLGGDIEVRSTIGQGSIFTVWMPLPPAEADAQARGQSSPHAALDPIQRPIAGHSVA